MKDEIRTMVITLRAHGLSVSAVEKELGYSNGLIGKAAKGDSELSTEKFEKLQKYFNEKCNIKPKISEATQTVVTPKGDLKQEPTKAKMERISAEVARLNKEFGEGAVITLVDKVEGNYDVVSTGSFGLDAALGIWGLPRGKMIEIYGWEGTGKTTICLNIVADAQKQGLNCLWVDAENAFDIKYATTLGVDVSKMKYSQPKSGEEGLQVAERLISSGDVQVVIFDSVAALVPKGEIEGSMGDAKLGLHARLMSQACRKMENTIKVKNALVVFINQLRHKIGMTFGSPEVTTGGNALKFFSSIRLEVRRSLAKENMVMNGDVTEGNKTTVKVVKNRCAPPFRTATFDLIYGKGIDKSSEILEFATQNGVIKKEGNTYWFEETKLGVGIDNAKTFLDDNEGLRDEIENKLKK